MTPEALKENLGVWRMTPDEFAEYIDVHIKTVYNWLKGNHPIPHTIDVIANLRKNQAVSPWDWRTK